MGGCGVSGREVEGEVGVGESAVGESMTMISPMVGSRIEAVCSVAIS